MRRALLLLTFAAITTSCSHATRSTPWQDVREVTPAFLGGGTASSTGAAAPRAGDPSLAVDGYGRVALTWVTRDSLGADAWASMSTDSGRHWSVPTRLNIVSGKVSSYAESRPVAAWGRDGLLAVAWAAARDTGLMADDVAVRVSPDAGRSWGAVALVNADHADPLSTYHGFASLTVLPDGRPMVAWIDGRASAGTGDEPARAEIFASTSPDGGVSWGDNIRVAGDVCPCCHIMLASSMRQTGVIDVAVGYRGATNDLRDPRLALSRDGGVTFALDTLVSADRWKLPGCPSVGPAFTMDIGGGQYAWYTGESPEDDSLPGRPAPGVYMVPWRVDGGAFGPKRVLGDSLGEPSRPLLARSDNGTIVGAIGDAASGTKRKVLALRKLELDGTLTPWLYLGSGVRSAAIAGEGARSAWATWAETDGDGTRVRVVRLSGR